MMNTIRTTIDKHTLCIITLPYGDNNDPKPPDISLLDKFAEMVARSKWWCFLNGLEFFRVFPA
jgi:hypothetical protein